MHSLLEDYKARRTRNFDLVAENRDFFLATSVEGGRGRRGSRPLY